MPGSALFLVSRDLDRVTGGNLYDRAVIERLRERGWRIEVREPGDLSGGVWDAIVVDSMAFRSGRPQTDIPYAALVHEIPSAAAGFPAPTVQERDVFRFAAMVIAVSHWLADRAETFTSSPVTVVTPGIDPALLESPEPAARDLVLCVGGAVPGKGVPEAIDVFAASAPSGTTLAIVGDLDADDEEAVRVREAIERCPRPVQAPGFVARKELVDLYGRSRVLLSASRYEGWPVAVAEAMASGVPVVGYDDPGMRELVRGGRDGLLAADGNRDELAAALGDLLGDRELCRAMGHSARRRAHSFPGWDETGDRFADALERLVQATGAR